MMRSDHRLSSFERSVVLVVALANLIPVWAFRYFPGQDTPNHLYAGEILKVLLDGSAPRAVSEAFAATMGLKSNMAFHALLLTLVKAGLSVELAHRVILSGYALGLPAAALFCARAAAPGSVPLALLFLPLTWNWFVVQGLYNYALSLIPALVWLGLVARDGGTPRRGAAAALAAAALAVFFCHLGTYLALLFITTWRLAALEPGPRVSLRARAAAAWPLLLALAPSLAVAAVAAITSLRTGAAAAEPTLSAWETYDVPMAVGTFFAEFAIRYRPSDALALGPPLLLLAALPLWAARRRSEPSSSRWPRWPLHAAGALAILYLLLPHIAAGSDASPRLRPLIVFCLFCYGGVQLSARARRAVSTLGLVCGLGGAALLCASFATLNRGLEDFTSGIPFVPRGARLYPMVFDARSPSILVKPFLHAWGYYGVERDVVTPFAFAWHPTRFPYRYRALPLHVRGALPSDSEDEPGALLDGRACESARRLAPSLACDDLRRQVATRLADLGTSYDYVLTWQAPSDFSTSLLARGYRVLHAQGAMTLYKTPTPLPAS